MKRIALLIGSILLLAGCQTTDNAASTQSAQVKGCKPDFPRDLPSLKVPPVPAFKGEIKPLETPVLLSPTAMVGRPFRAMAAMESSKDKKISFELKGYLTSTEIKPGRMRYDMNINRKLLDNAVHYAKEKATYSRSVTDWVKTVQPGGNVNKSHPVALALGGINLPLPIDPVSQDQVIQKDGSFQLSKNLTFNIQVAGKAKYQGEDAVVLNFSIQDPCGFRHGGGYELVSLLNGQKIHHRQTTWVREYGIISAITWIERDLGPLPVDQLQ